MHHHLFTLQPHIDVAKFELEDGVIRTAAASLLAQESTIRDIIVDVGTERTLALDREIGPPAWESSMLVSSEDRDEVAPDALAELVVEVASIVDHWPVLRIEQSDLDHSWVGTATPGPKVSFLVRRASGIDEASFTSWLRDVLNDALEQTPGMGSRALGSLDVDSAHDAMASFWFSDESALNDAVGSGVFSSLLAAELIEPGSIRSWSTVEHRLAPNPNAWSMPTGRLMPVREFDPDS